MTMLKYDCVIIGAGPAGSMTAHYLRKENKDISILMIEKDVFPRFILGESLLPHSMDFFEEVGLIEPIIEGHYQLKNGATFYSDERSVDVDFSKKSAKGWSTTYQVKRDSFDLMLCDEAKKKNVDILYGQTITHLDRDTQNKITHLTLQDNNTQKNQKIEADFIFDASGFSALLSDQYDLNLQSDLPVRKTYFTHIYDHISESSYDRQKIIISLDDHDKDIWAWLIPFSDQTASVGFVVPAEQCFEGSSQDVFTELLGRHKKLKDLLKNYQLKTDIHMMEGYSRKTKSCFGEGFVSVGNAGAFLDPVFSSGVTIACLSAKLAAQAYQKQLIKGVHAADIWKKDYEEPLFSGISVFEEFVKSWYDGQLQQIIFSYEDKHDTEVAGHVVSILAGYAWDKDNLFFNKTKQVLNMIEKYK